MTQNLREELAETKNELPRRARAARIVLTPGRPMSYKVIFADENGETSEHGFATVAECETFIRANMPVPTQRSVLYDRQPGEA